MKFTTKKVSLWKNGILITANLTKEEAEEMIKKGKAKIITDGHIDLISKEKWKKEKMEEETK